MNCWSCFACCFEVQHSLLAATLVTEQPGGILGLIRLVIVIFHFCQAILYTHLFLARYDEDASCVSLFALRGGKLRYGRTKRKANHTYCMLRR